MKSIPFHRTKKFKELQAVWEAKLSKSGFKDIEKGRIGSTGQDLCQRTHFKRNLKEINQTYYTWAFRQIYSSKFKSHKHKLIWIGHSVGLSAREIGRRHSLHHTGICQLIGRIKTYLKESENM